MKSDTISRDTDKPTLSRWLSGAARVWCVVNGIGTAVRLLFVVIGIPWGLLCLMRPLDLALFPGSWLTDLLARYAGLHDMPSWYYALVYPVAPALINLPAYGLAALVGCFLETILWARPTRSLRRTEIFGPHGADGPPRDTA